MNHSVLTLNILHGLHGACESEELYTEVETMYFRWLDLKESPLQAEKKTLDWIYVSTFLHRIYPYSELKLSPDIQASLHEFIRKRYEVYARNI